MAANKFATMLHRKTNKITVILVYALLEWILIVLLLLNSLFSYLIIKFTEFFGLKPPCLWCTRLDHIFDPAKGNENMHRDFLCEVHAKEISKLGYCSCHRKLAESPDMCEDCLSSRPEFQGFSKNFSLFPWIKGFGVIGNHKEKVGENGEASLLNCSCCGVNLENTVSSSYILLKTPSWDVLECVQKENLITDAAEFDDSLIQQVCDSDEKILDFASGLCDNKKILEEKHHCDQMISGLDDDMDMNSVSVLKEDGKEGKMENVEEKENLTMEDKSAQACVGEDAAPLEIPPEHLEFFLDYSGHKLVPFELIDPITEKSQNKGNAKTEYHNSDKDQYCSKGKELQVEEKDDLVVKNENRSSDGADAFVDVDINVAPKFEMLDSVKMEEDENCLFFHAKEECSLVIDVCDVQEMTGDAAGKMHLDIYTACEKLARMKNKENGSNVSIGADIPDEVQNQESVHSNKCTNEDPSTSSANFYEADDHGPMQLEEQMVELQCLPIQDMMNNHPSFQYELTDIDEDQSVDGSVTSELESSNEVVTIEHLKSAIKSKTKNLQALYAELEKERNASAEAANQTMAMINRLQEEKAAMQMEALQYQRMMEEQSEYDQEALQLLNEILVKREKEKQELEKELEVYRKKLLECELREKIRLLKKSNGSSRSGFFSSASCTEDSDGLSVDLNHEAKEDEGSCGYEENGDQNTPVDAVVNLEESLADFEEERLSILSQLKVLEEKLMALEEDDDEQQFEGENGHFNGEANGHADGFVNGKHYQQRRIAGQKGKSLLPLFDAISDETDVIVNGNGLDSYGVHKSYASMLQIENKKVSIEEEVDYLYERLQALEADKEFVKHCVSSLKKGDKGIDLLKEILQHLRHLRNVELRVSNLSHSAII